MNTDLAAQAAMDRWNEAGFEALSGEEKVLVTVWSFESKVANGGFAQYYRATAGDLAFYAPAALREINAQQLAALAAEANAVFGGNGPPRDREARRDAMEGLGHNAVERWREMEARFFRCDEDCDELMEAFLERSASAV